MTTGNRRWVLSGGLASGKSKVRELLADAGIATVDADSIGHSVIAPDGPAFPEVVRRWPDVIRDGLVHRPSLAEVVFDDPGELAALEAITHPHIMETIRSRVANVEGVVAVEIPLAKHGLGDDWRRIIVDCRDEIRLGRAIARGMSEEDARKRMAAQPSRAEWLAMADLVIPNHGDFGELATTVRVIGRLLPRFSREQHASQ